MLYFSRENICFIIDYIVGVFILLSCWGEVIACGVVWWLEHISIVLFRMFRVVIFAGFFFARECVKCLLGM